ncbi:hypothetical protein [Streptomyces sp. NPDC003710]
MRIEDIRRHVTTPLTRPAFPPRTAWFTDREYLEIVSASHILTDLTLAPVKPVFDYLKADTQ